MIIDAHMHIDDLPALGWKLDAELCIRRMDEAGIDAAVVMTITDWPEVNAQSIELVAEACAAHPGRLYGPGSIPGTAMRRSPRSNGRSSSMGSRGLAAPRDDDRAPGRSRDAALDQNGRRARRSDALPLWRRALDNAAGIAQAAQNAPRRPSSRPWGLLPRRRGHRGGIAFQRRSRDIRNAPSRESPRGGRRASGLSASSRERRAGLLAVAGGYEGALAGLEPEAERAILAENARRILDRVS